MASNQFIVVAFSEDRTVLAGGNPLGQTNAVLTINSGTHTFTLDGEQDYEPKSHRRKVANTSPIEPLKITFQKLLCLWLFGCLALVGCAHHPTNVKLDRYDPGLGYRFTNTPPSASNSDELFVVLAFSGGGTRAAALAYGALEELGRTTMRINGADRRLLDEVDIISSISGGSFTAAYYGLHRDSRWPDFEKRFLRKNVTLALALRLLNPVNWFRLCSRDFDRIDMAAEYFDKQVFSRATYADIAGHRARPFIILNATDMSLVTQFEFIQEQFDIISSDLGQFPVSRAVAASSAFPILLSPITLHNYGLTSNGYAAPQWISDALEDRQLAPREYAHAKATKSYFDATNRPFIHLLDGGIGDNLGLRGVTYAMTSIQGLWSLKHLLNTRIKHLLVITVNAKNGEPRRWDRRHNAPGVAGVFGVVTTGPMGRYSDETVQYLGETFETWRQENSVARKYNEAVPEAKLPMRNEVQFYHIEVNFQDLPERETALRERIIKLGTTYHLSDAAIDDLRRAASILIAGSPELTRLKDNLQ